MAERKSALEGVERLMVDLNFYKGKTVLVTGHTGFKGTWLCKILIDLGANVVGYSLNPPTEPNIFTLSDIEKNMTSIIGDVRDYEKLNKTFEKYRPQCVFHLAAQPLVCDGYTYPRYTYDVNVMGTVNVLECVRNASFVKSFLNVTTDKVYYNDDDPERSFKEDDPLDGYDPYSNSKSCSELVTHSYKKSFFRDMRCAISTVRAGNVIGGGDFAVNRIIPDCIRAVMRGEDIIVRNPFSVRPYQHVLEPLFVYLEIVEKQFNDIRYADYYNVGPDECDCVCTGDLVTKFCKAWGDGLNWIDKSDNGPHEAAYLRLDNKKIKTVFGWDPHWHIDDAINMVVSWTKVYLRDKKRVSDEMNDEIKKYLNGVIG